MTTPQSEFDRMHAYYTSQGERYSFAEIWPRAVKARLQLLDSIDGLTAQQAAAKPNTEEWSIREVALHILNSSRGVRAVVKALADGQAGEATGIDPPRESTEFSLDELRTRLRDDGIEWTVAIDALPERPDVTPTSRHPMFGELHARAWYLFQRTHDLDHATQIEAIKKALGLSEGSEKA